MSAIALIWAANVKGLKPATKIVLIQLSERHNKDTGRCDPRLALLAEDCEMSRASLLRHLSVLEEQGFITRVARGRDNGGRISTQYDLHMGQRSQFETGGKGLKTEGQRSQNGGGKGLTLETPYKEPVLNQEEPDTRERDCLFSEMEEQESKGDPFDEFWEAYPKKAGKAQARKAWDAAIRNTEPSVIVEGARRYAKWLTSGRPGEFRPHAKHPQGWITGQRWTDPELWEGQSASGSAPPRPFMQPMHGEVVR
ncbi:MAG: helix-turn-helix domain-containing protein [Pseudomonadota bacterium]